jgi:AraC-like DNA-binding protein
MTVSILLVRGLVESALAAGLDRDQLLATAGFDGSRLADVDGRVELDELNRVQIAALDLSGDPAFGLHMGERASATPYDLVAYLTSHATTLREGIASLLRFGRILSELPAELTEHGDVATLKLVFGHGKTRDARCTRARAEFVVTGFSRLVGYVAGSSSPVHAACFEHPAPDYLSEYVRIFADAARFEQAFTGISFDSSLLDREQLHKNPELHAVLSATADRKLNRLNREVSYAERLRGYLAVSSAAERPDMAGMAKRLGLSVRSLRRRLADEGASYPGLIEEEQAARAKRLLDASDRSIHEVAYDMGFSDPSAFHRAFKRWTGMTPSQYRAQR